MATHELTPASSPLARRESYVPSQSASYVPEGASGLTRFLGWFSVGLGVSEILAPGMINRISGTANRKSVVRLFGLRELANGIGILTQPQPAKWLWARVAGDAADAMAIVRGAEPGRTKAALGSLATVAGITALDIRCAKECSTNEKDGPETGRAEASLLISRPPEVCYRFWLDVENIPRFAAATLLVQKTGEKTSHWSARIPRTSRQVEWDAEITGTVPNERISWRTTSPGGVAANGSVVFEAAPGGRGTIVRVQLDYDQPGRTVTDPLSQLLGKHPRQIIYKSLRRLKQLIELGEILTTEGQPSGRRTDTTWLDAIAQ